MATKAERRKAQALIDLEYGPQAAQIRDLWGQTRKQYLNDLSAARQTERAIKTAAAAAEPKLRTIYSTARDDLGESNSFVDQALATMARGEDTGLSKLIGQQMARERGAARNANTAARTGALTELTNRASAATAGRAASYRTAKDTLLGQRKDLTQRLADLTGQSGAKMTALLSDMEAQRSAANAKARETTGKRLTSGPYRGLTQGEVDAMTPEELRDFERKNNPDKAAKAKSNRRTVEAQQGLSDRVAHALSVAQTYSGKYTRGQLAQTLLKGQVPTKTTDKTGAETTVPGLPRVDQFVLSLALDMAYDKHVSRANARRLHKLGYNVADIEGAVSFGDWLKTPAGQAWQERERFKQTAVSDRNAGPRGVR